MAPCREYHGDHGVDIEFLDEKEALCECCHKEPAEPNGICTTCNEYLIPLIAAWTSLPTYIQGYVKENIDNFNL